MNAAGARVGAVLLSACIVLPGRVAAVDRTLGAGLARPTASGTAWSVPQRAGLTRDLDGLLDGAATLRGAHVGLLAIDTRTGTVLYARNADDAFVPASTLKLLTGSAALATLTPEYRFRTQALLDPARTTLSIRAGGDPLLNALDLDAMAQSLHAAGIVELTSGVRIDAGELDSAPYPPGWSWDDFAYDYAPVVSAATVEENVVHLTVAPGATAGAPVTLSGVPSLFAPVGAGSATCPATDAVVVRLFATTAERGFADTLDIRRAPGGCIDVVGSLPLGSESETLDAAVPSPLWYMRALAERALTRAGIAVAHGGASLGTGGGGDPNDVSANRAVWTHDGEPLSDVLADMWWPSDNLIAELLLKAIGRHAGALPGTTERGADVERDWLGRIGVDPATVTIADGSGLSSYDRITPRALGTILQADWNGPFRNIVLDDLPLAGVRGTLAKSFIGSLAERRTFAKTGSVNHARALAGYVETLHHGALTFVWSVDDWMGADGDLSALRARVLSRMIGD